MRLNTLTACQLIEKIRHRQISIEDIAKDCLSAVKSAEAKIKAWEYIDPQHILYAARELDKQPNLRFLSGVPVGIKDIFNTKDMPTAMGSPIWNGFTPGNDARVVHNIRINDGLIFGKTVTAEFAVHHLPKGKTVNPHNNRHTPGTSSSGSAAAVAAYMVPLALGTQTAGSIIRPASYCGVYGFKPTFGLIPRTGMLKTTDTLDTVGCFARSIPDLRLIFDVIRVKGKNYPFVFKKIDNQRESKLSGKNKIHLGFIIDGLHVFTEFEKYALESLRNFVNKIAKKERFRISKIKPSANFNKIHRVHGIIYDKTLSYYFKEEFKQHTLISKTMYEIIERGNKISSAQYVNALEEQSIIRHRIDDELSNYDIVPTLSTAGIAPLIDESEKADTCLVWTFLGYPALSLPLFRGPGNLPFGLQMVAKRYEDYKLLKIAEEMLDEL